MVKSFYNEFKTPIVTVALIFLAFLIYTKVFGPIPFYINSVNTTKTDLFSASGSADVTEVPDEASISVGVTKSATTVQDAQKQSNTVSAKLIDDLKKIGVKEENIKTTNYSVNPTYSIGFGTDQSKASGYEVTQNIEVKIQPIEMANKIIDLATKDGANVVGGVNFTFSDKLQKTLEEKATNNAVTDAKSKAEILAKAAGVRLGRIINVISSSNGVQPVFRMDVASTKAQTDEIVPSNVTPGQNTVTIGVTLYYETY